jgi:hypothetical protein
MKRQEDRISTRSTIRFCTFLAPSANKVSHCRSTAYLVVLISASPVLPSCLFSCVSIGPSDNLPMRTLAHLIVCPTTNLLANKPIFSSAHQPMSPSTDLTHLPNNPQADKSISSRAQPMSTSTDLMCPTTHKPINPSPHEPNNL